MIGIAYTKNNNIQIKLCPVSARVKITDVEAEAESGKFLWKQKLEVMKGHHF